MRNAPLRRLFHAALGPPLAATHLTLRFPPSLTRAFSIFLPQSSHSSSPVPGSQRPPPIGVGVSNAMSETNKSKSLDGSALKGAQTAWDMLSEEQMQRHITTGCEELDGILGGGIHCKEVTEIGGVPGIGKTQLGIQLAVNVQIPIEYGGLGGKAVYIDTEGSFMVERAHEIAEGCINDLFVNFAHQRKEFLSCSKKLEPKTFLANIFYFRICSYTEQIAAINYLEKFLEEHKDVKIVIVDSISFHFRQDFDDLALRTRLLGAMSLQLMKFAKKHCLAVILLNQVTTKFVEGSFQLTLALGDSWSHSSTNRIILYWNGNDRYAYMDKSPSLRSASAPFSVTSNGIRNAISHCKRVRMM